MLSKTYACLSNSNSCRSLWHVFVNYFDFVFQFHNDVLTSNEVFIGLDVGDNSVGWLMKKLMSILGIF